MIDPNLLCDEPPTCSGLEGCKFKGPGKFCGFGGWWCLRLKNISEIPLKAFEAILLNDNSDAAINC